MYELQQQTFRTPSGRMVDMVLRADTNDYNTLLSCLNEDEYQLRGRALSGKVIDIGAYIGGVTVALLVDFPEIEVTAIEPVPGNLDLLRQNLDLNGVTDRCTVIDGAAGDGRKVNIRYGYQGSEMATHHAFVGNVSLIGVPGPENPHEVRELKSVRISSLGEFGFAKIDIEGGEWQAFTYMTAIPRIVGEVHNVPGHTDPQGECLTMLGPTHDVTFSGPQAGPCGFEAVRR